MVSENSKLRRGETAPRRRPPIRRLFGQDAGEIRRSESKDRRDHRRDAERDTGLGFFQAQHPTRYFDVGIAEEHAALFACGLATQGLKPFLTIYSTFMQRAYDMIIHDIALQNLNVALCMDRAGLSGDDGPTHHGLVRYRLSPAHPNIVHMQPKDEDEFVDMLWTMANYNSGPIAIRYPRGPARAQSPKQQPKLLEIGKAEVVQHGREVAIFGLGNMFDVGRGSRANAGGTRHFRGAHQPALDQAARHRHARVFRAQRRRHLHDRRSRSPQWIRLRRHGASAQPEINTPVVRIGWPDQFIEHGTIPILRKKHGLTAEALVEKVLPLLQKETQAINRAPRKFELAL